MQPAVKIGHGLGNLDLLRTDRLAAPAANTGARAPGLRDCGQGHRRDKAALGETVLIVQREQRLSLIHIWYSPLSAAHNGAV